MKKAHYWELLGKALDGKTEGKLLPLIPEIWKGIRFARKHHENHLLSQFLSLIHYYYLTIMQDEKEALKIKQELDEVRIIRRHEESAQDGYRQLTFSLKRTRKPSTELKNKLAHYCEEHKELIKLNNAKISIFVFPMLIKNASINGEYDNAITYCKKAISFFEDSEEKKTQHFQSMMIPLLLIQKQHVKLTPLLDQLKSKITGKDYNLSIIICYQTINYLHLKEYDKAYNHLLEADRKHQIDKALKEQWYIIKGFFQILSNAGRLENCKRFRISKIINEVPIFNKDKYGNFINVLILKIILGIQENRDKLIDNKDAIEKAYQRYCIKGSREQILLRILLRFPIFFFDYEKIKKASESDIEQLKTMNMESESLDIIPYADLLEIALREVNSPVFI